MNFFKKVISGSRGGVGGRKEPRPFSPFQYIVTCPRCGEKSTQMVMFPEGELGFQCPWCSRWVYLEIFAGVVIPPKIEKKPKLLDEYSILTSPEVSERKKFRSRLYLYSCS